MHKKLILPLERKRRFYPLKRKNNKKNDLITKLPPKDDTAARVREIWVSDSERERAEMEQETRERGLISISMASMSKLLVFLQLQNTTFWLCVRCPKCPYDVSIIFI